MPSDSESGACEVRGVWFTTLRQFLYTNYQRDVRMRLRDRLGEREAFLDASPWQWFPEKALQMVLHDVYDVVAEQDEHRFSRIVEGAALFAVRRSFAQMAKIHTASAALDRASTLWGFSRRGPSRLRVLRDRDVTLLYHEQFPFCADELYRIATPALARALVIGVTGRSVDARIGQHGVDWMTVEVTCTAPVRLPKPPALPLDWGRSASMRSM